MVAISCQHPPDLVMDVSIYLQHTTVLSVSSKQQIFFTGKIYSVHEVPCLYSIGAIAQAFLAAVGLKVRLANHITYELVFGIELALPVLQVIKLHLF